MLSITSITGQKTIISCQCLVSRLPTKAMTSVILSTGTCHGKRLPCKQRGGATFPYGPPNLAKTLGRYFLIRVSLLPILATAPEPQAVKQKCLCHCLVACCGNAKLMTRYNFLNLPMQVASSCIQSFCFHVRFAVLLSGAFGCFAFGCVHPFCIRMHLIMLLSNAFSCFAFRCIHVFCFMIMTFQFPAPHYGRIFSLTFSRFACLLRFLNDHCRLCIRMCFFVDSLRICILAVFSPSYYLKFVRHGLCWCVFS